MSRTHLAAAALAATLLAGPARAQSTPTPGAAPRPAPAPATPAAPARSAVPAAPGARPPARFAVNHGVCKQFLALPTDLRAMVVAWTAGRYHRLDRWVLDEATARKVVAGVEQECAKAPDGLFRMKVVGEVEKIR